MAEEVITAAQAKKDGYDREVFSGTSTECAAVLGAVRRESGKYFDYVPVKDGTHYRILAREKKSA